MNNTIATKSILFFFMFFSMDCFSQNIDYNFIPYRKANKWGFANAAKTIIINPKYDEARWFAEGLAAVKVGAKWGYINTAGKFVIPAKFTVAKNFRKGYIPLYNKVGGDTIIYAGASLMASGYEGCINAKGVMLPQCPAIAENVMEANKIAMETIVKEKVYSIANKDGLFEKIVDDYKIAGNPETFYVAQKGGLFGVFNSKFSALMHLKINELVTSNKNASNDVVHAENKTENEINKLAEENIAKAEEELK
jgi:WG containing repeat